MVSIRSISNVCKIIHYYIPNEEILFNACLKNIRSSIENAAPELIKSTHYWIKLSDIINNSIPKNYEDLNEWEKNIVDILIDKDRSKFINDFKNIEENSSNNQKLNTNLSKDEMTLLMINSVRI